MLSNIEARSIKQKIVSTLYEIYLFLTDTTSETENQNLSKPLFGNKEFATFGFANSSSILREFLIIYLFLFLFTQMTRFEVR